MSDHKYHFKDIVRVTSGFYKDWKGYVWQSGYEFSVENTYLIKLLQEDEEGQLVDAGCMVELPERILDTFKLFYDEKLGSYERVKVWGSHVWLPKGEIVEEGTELWSVPRTARALDTWCMVSENMAYSKSRISQASATLGVELLLKDWREQQKVREQE